MPSRLPRRVRAPTNMKCAFRCTLSVLLLSTLLLLVSCFLFLEHQLEDLWDQYHVTDYAYNYLRTFLQHDPLRHSATYPESLESQDKIIVMARLAGEDTRWVDEHLWEYAKWRSPTLSHLSLHMLTVTAGKMPFTPSTPQPPPPTAHLQLPSTKATRQWLTSPT